MPDHPKTLATFLDAVSSLGVNVLEVNHERSNMQAPIGSCVVQMLVETRNHGHIDELFAHLRRQGYVIIPR